MVAELVEAFAWLNLWPFDRLRDHRHRWLSLSKPWPMEMLWIASRLSTVGQLAGDMPGLPCQPADMPWTYLLICADDSFYVGSTRNLENRLEQHMAGAADSYTASRRPVRLAWAEEFEHVVDAWAAERRIHGWSRAKKQALIDGRLYDLKALARNYTEFGKPGG